MYDVTEATKRRLLVMALCALCGIYRVCVTRMPWMCNLTSKTSHAGDLIVSWEDGVERFGGLGVWGFGGVEVRS